VISATLGLTGPAVAQGLPECPSSEDALTSDIPDYLRVGESYKISAGIDSSVTNVAVTVDGVVTPLAEQGSDLNAILPGRSGTGEVAIIFEWDQNEGFADACHGVDRYRVPVIGAQGKAGRVDSPRLSSSYRVRYRGGNLDLGSGNSRATWRFTPSCRYFGCATQLTVNRKRQGTFYPAEDIDYQLSASKGSSGYCDTRNLITGAVTRVKPAFYLSVRYDLRSTKTVNRIAERVAGKIVVRARLASRCGGGVRYFTKYFQGVRK